MRVDGMSSGADGLESVQACHRVLLTSGFPVPLLVDAVNAAHLEMALLTTGLRLWFKFRRKQELFVQNGVKWTDCQKNGLIFKNC